MLVTDEELERLDERPNRLRFLRDLLICLCILGVAGAVLWLVMSIPE